MTRHAAPWHGGVEGNERLTDAIALVLLILLGLEAPPSG